MHVKLPYRSDMPYFFRKEFVYFVLLLTTVVLIGWQHWGMNLTYTFSMPSRDNFHVINDDINQGKSIGLLVDQSGFPKLVCDIQLSYSFPFCSLVVPLLENELAGMNLEQFDTLTLEITYQSNERDTLLVYLSNYEQIDGNEVLRSNLQALVPKRGRHSYQIELSQFYVPSWWIFSKPELSNADSQLDNVRGIQISTGDHRGARHVEFTLHHFEFKGKWIRTKDLYSHIITFWLVVALFQLFVTSIGFRRNYLSLRQEAKKLNEINSFLKIERDKYEGLAKHDSLTGCLNRNGLRDILERVLKAFALNNESAMLLMLDIDSFKLLNDSYGHDEGDRVLINLANLLSLHIRDNDHLIRWGGEEFAIISERTSQSGALSLAENLRKIIETTSLTEHAQITVSFGVAELKSTQVDEWFKEADNYLYQAKSAGKNQVVYEKSLDNVA